MGKIYLQFSTEGEGVKIPVGVRPLIRKCCAAVLKKEGVVDNCEISVTVVDNETIRSLNSQTRGIDKETDVLSFPLGENGEYEVNYATDALLLGDIVISLTKAVEQAQEYGHSVEREIAFLTVHSMLHLLGYDHIEENDRKIMRAREEEILNYMGITRE
ncbi:MAG: rRNA maturation RNase YbeY [Clostridia bacterium]|nr:rRNA maturation RNase YbeY [Clostridia bacterium]